jgi:CubicO group peptidase (beta-lactamase class C family)
MNALLLDAIQRRVSPAVALEIGRSTGPVRTWSLGRVAFDDDAAPLTTAALFDLASLTKVMATTATAVRLVERGELGLEDPLERWLPDWPAARAHQLVVADLLAHCSGLPAHAELYRSATSLETFVEAIIALPLEYRPRTKAVYSDPGFIMLDYVLRQVTGLDASARFDWIPDAVGVRRADLGFRPDAGERARAVPTGWDPWRARWLQGEVHDANAAALGGAAGHAGLFGMLGATGAFSRVVLTALRGRDGPLGAADTLRRFAEPTAIPGSSRALGWDTMRATSSCGSRMSPSAIGHTGFTGTSIWIDHERDVYVVLLTNRVIGRASARDMLEFRRAVHDLAVETLG